mmetsp:Transcript_18979/g.55056  ORF Transcript_18979/g.55056 Transcript_18979/m.55056 type:complete len:143 (-) Transcript_18979:558-986(-)
MDRTIAELARYLARYDISVPKRPRKKRRKADFVAAAMKLQVNVEDGEKEEEGKMPQRAEVVEEEEREEEEVVVEPEATRGIDDAPMSWAELSESALSRKTIAQLKEYLDQHNTAVKGVSPGKRPLKADYVAAAVRLHAADRC